MSTLETAIEIAVAAHKGQVDKRGEPYILHPLAVMLICGNPLIGPLSPQQLRDAQIVGVLHDVIEDTDITLADLANKGFSPIVIAALDGVTRREGEPYSKFIDRAKAHPISRHVKVADLSHNLGKERVTGDPNEEDRRIRYRAALDKLWGYERKD